MAGRVQLPQDPAEDLAMVAPGLAAPAAGGQQGCREVHAWWVSSNTAASWLVCFLERDAIEQHHHQQPSAAAVLVSLTDERGTRVRWAIVPASRSVQQGNH
jgi:invasion protein IalB